MPDVTFEFVEQVVAPTLIKRTLRQQNITTLRQST